MFTFAQMPVYFHDECFTPASRWSVECFLVYYDINKVNKEKETKATKMIT